ncbi:MAG: hypothetical protein WDO19_00370 [Bacteroidota bacterium]
MKNSKRNRVKRKDGGKDDLNGLAAGAVVASAIMNSDAFISKR